MVISEGGIGGGEGRATARGGSRSVGCVAREVRASWCSGRQVGRPRARSPTACRRGAAFGVLLQGTGGEITFFGADVVAGVAGLEIDGAEGAVVPEVGRGVDEGVLAAQLLLDVVEAYGDVLDLGGEEGLAAGGFGHGFEDLVAFVFTGADVGADGVDGGLGALAL